MARARKEMLSVKKKALVKTKIFSAVSGNTHFLLSMPRRNPHTTKTISRAAACLAALLLIQACASSRQVAADLYRNAQSAETSKDLKKAEQLYTSCVSAGLDARREDYQLAALNRLSDLERQLSNQSKAKAYMNQAATLAENIKEGADNNNVIDDSKLFSLPKEQHIALMRLADWEFEDGNYISARKLFEKASALEQQLQIDANSNESAFLRIARLDSRAEIEHKQVALAMSKDPSAALIRGPAYEHRLQDRRKILHRWNEKLNQYRADGTDRSGKEVLRMLQLLRTTYGYTEPEFRSAMNFGVKTFLLHGHPDQVASIVEQDLPLYKNFSQEDLDNAVPQAVDNATCYAQDLVLLAMIYRHQGRFEESLGKCMEAQKLSKQVIPANSSLEWELALETAIALEHNNRYAEAVPYRKLVLAKANQNDVSQSSYADLLGNLGTDYFEGGNSVEAEAAFKEAIRLKRIQKSKESFSYILLAYAKTLLALGRNAEARKILLESIPDSQKEGGFQPIHNYSLLVSACRDINPKEAVIYGKKSIELMRKNGTYNHDYMMPENCVRVAEIQVCHGLYKDAIKTLDEGYDWQKSHGKELTAHTAGMLNLKGTALHELGKLDEEEATRLKAIELCRRFNPPQPGPLASTLFQTASRLQQRSKWDQAEKLYKEALLVSAEKDNPTCRQVSLQSKATLGVIAAVHRKDTKLAEQYKSEILPIDKKYFCNITHSDISMLVTVADLCFILHDKRNLKLIMDTAQSIYDKDPQKQADQLERLRRHRKTYAALLN